jgi:hypothetical protein
MRADAPLPEGHKRARRDRRGRVGCCFFWNTSDRIYIVAAPKMSEEQAVTLADWIH